MNLPFAHTRITGDLDHPIPTGPNHAAASLRPPQSLAPALDVIQQRVNHFLLRNSAVAVGIYAGKRPELQDICAIVHVPAHDGQDSGAMADTVPVDIVQRECAATVGIRRR